MVRVLMRQEKTMKVICNHVADPRIVLKPNAGSDRSWVWNAFDYTDGTLEEITFALRFANSDSANEFQKASCRLPSLCRVNLFVSSWDKSLPRSIFNVRLCCGPLVLRIYGRYARIRANGFRKHCSQCRLRWSVRNRYWFWVKERVSEAALRRLLDHRSSAVIFFEYTSPRSLCSGFPNHPYALYSCAPHSLTQAPSSSSSPPRIRVSSCFLVWVISMSISETITQQFTSAQGIVSSLLPGESNAPATEGAEKLEILRVVKGDRVGISTTWELRQQFCHRLVAP